MSYVLFNVKYKEFVSRGREEFTSDLQKAAIYSDLEQIESQKKALGNPHEYYPYPVEHRLELVDMFA